MGVTAKSFKEALSRWATGVTIVTSRSGDRIHGMTVSAFTEVSLDPPLVLVCADKTSNTHQVIAAGGNFAVNVLAADQRELSNLFASKRDEARRFDDLECDSGTTGAPFIPGALVALDCRVVDTLDAGDHVVYVGRVEEAHVREREPLLYYAGRYGVMKPTDR